MKRALCFVLAGCSVAASTLPQDERAYYTDPTCAARPASLSSRTVEPGWHYDGSDPKVRAFDVTRPSSARRLCWRDDGAEPCPCRDLGASEVAFEVQR